MDTNGATISERTALGDSISTRLIRSMQGMRATTEHAVLTIGGLLNRIVDVATHDNGEIRDSLTKIVGDSGQSNQDDTTITHAIQAQTSSVEDFVAKSRQFFTDQLSFANAAGEACGKIDNCARSVSDLTVKSQILALNMQIESARLGSKGQAFTVIGEEMKHFAADVRAANEAIKTALKTLLEAIPRIQTETSRMDDRATDFSQQLELQITEVKRRTDSLFSFLQSTLDQAEQRNNEVVKSSHAMLSELQFQDPMAQALAHAEHDIAKLQKLVAVGECDDVSLAEIEPAIGEDGSAERASGEIDLF